MLHRPCLSPHFPYSPSVTGLNRVLDGIVTGLVDLRLEVEVDELSQTKDISTYPPHLSPSLSRPSAPSRL